MSDKVDRLNEVLREHDTLGLKYGTPEHTDWVNRVRVEAEAVWGQVWNTSELQRDFTIESFAFCLAFGRRKSDNRRVSIDFMHSPRFYHSVRESS